MNDAITLWALIDDGGTVRGTAGWNGVAPWMPPPGVQHVVELEPDEPCGPGWIYRGSHVPRFAEPAEEAGS